MKDEPLLYYKTREEREACRKKSARMKMGGFVGGISFEDTKAKPIRVSK